MINLGINLIEYKKDYRGGLNTYILELIEELENRKLKIIIFTNKDSEIYLKNKFKKSNVIVFKKNKLIYLFAQLFCIVFNIKKLFSIIENYYYKDLKKIIENKCDIFYCPLSYLKPYDLKIPTVLSPHDFQHLHFPENFNWLRLKYRNMAFSLSMKKSNFIQASSNFIKNDIKSNFKINDNKIFVINEGVSNKFKVSKVNLNKNNYIFFPAQLWKHKNHLLVLKSIKYIYQKKRINFKIVMTGQKYNSYNLVSKFIQKNKKLKIKYLGKVSFKKLINLYKNSRLVLSPSIYESSSLPILESCKIGIPVICSDIEPNKELNKKLKLNLFKSSNVNSFSKTLLKVWFNKKLLNSQSKYNLKKIKNYSWVKTAKKYEKIFYLLNKKKSKVNL